MTTNIYSQHKTIKAVFPGTFDPLTLGHWDLIERSSKLFAHVIVAIANNPQKNTMFSLDERTKMLKAQLLGKHITNVEVKAFSNLLPQFLKEVQAQVLIRGIRTVGDYDYEMQLTGMYRMVMPNLQIVMLPASQDIACISSTLVRDVLRHQGDISLFVPPIINEYIHTKLAKLQ